MTKPITHASVFSGIGGPEVAAEMLGWVNLFHCEINPFGRAVLDYWFPNSASYEDITNTDFTPWRGRVNVLTGGFPCQPFSYAGKRRGAEDDRYLWPYMFRCIDQIQPDWVVCENVAGILTMVEQGSVSPMASQATLFDEGDPIPRYGLRETFTLQRICDDLDGHGYEVQPVLIPACSVGAPHRRDRVFIVGHRKEGLSSDSADKRLPGSPDSRAEGEVCRKVAEEGNNAQCGLSTAAAGSRGASAHTDGRGSGEVPLTVYAGVADGDLPLGNGGKRDASNTNGAGRKESQQSGRGTDPAKDGARLDHRTERSGCDGPAPRWVYDSNGNWLPTQSPVFRGNDGFPFDVDNLSIPFIGKKGPFSYWRVEAIKAYGNAIVPQVMYEIFRAIELVENNNQ